VVTARSADPADPAEVPTDAPAPAVDRAGVVAAASGAPEDVVAPADRSADVDDGTADVVTGEVAFADPEAVDVRPA
jgi:hypothetical protein